MSDAAELAALRAEISALRDAIKPRRKHTGRGMRRFVHCPVTAEEHAAIHDAASLRGLCVADLIRLALEPVLGRDLPRNRVIPVNMQASVKRTRDMSREELASVAKAGLIASRLLARETGAAVGQAASVPVPKLRGPQRPE